MIKSRYLSAFEVLTLELLHASQDGEITWAHAFERVVEVVNNMTEKEIITWRR